MTMSKNVLVPMFALALSFSSLACNSGKDKPADVTPDASDCPASGEEVGFAAACRASGGTEADGICMCSKTICDVGVICNFETKRCANESEAGGECDADTPSVCTNSGIGIGIVKECQNGHKVNVSCQTVSCNEAGDGCGECITSAAPVCTDSPSFVGEVTRCVNGKKVKETCAPYSCNGNECGTCLDYSLMCRNDENQKGSVIECQGGRGSKTIAMCGDVSCRADVPTCGECLNGALKCTEDNDNYAMMWRCTDGKWERIRNRLDPADSDYACPSHCRIHAYPWDQEQCAEEIQRNPDLCLGCDPCSGREMGHAYDDQNPCYDEARCAQVLAAEDPDYPPFRDYNTSLRLNDKRTMKSVFGYNFNNHEAVANPSDREEYFWLDLTNEKKYVSCNAEGTYYGVCHNSLQICINEHYHKEGYIVQCVQGALTDYDGNDDGIACKCEKITSPSNAEGCCYTRRNCFKNSTAVHGREMCLKPGAEAGYAGDNPDYHD